MTPILPLFLLFGLPTIISSYTVKEPRTRDFFIKIWKNQKIFKDINGTEYVFPLDLDEPVKYDEMEFHWKKTAEGQCSYEISDEIKTDILDKIVFNSEQPKEVYWTCTGHDMCSDLGCMGILTWIGILIFSIAVMSCILYRCFLRIKAVVNCAA